MTGAEGYADAVTSTREPSPQPSPAGRGSDLSRGDRLRAAILASLLHVVARVIGMLISLRVRRIDELPEFRKLGPGPVLWAMWHGDFFPALQYNRGRGICVIVSRSGDGEILARLLESFGYRTVRGSTSRGGTRATIDLAREVNRGRDAAVAIDGPRGPVLEAKPGVVLLAKMTGCPIVPLGMAYSRARQFGSWDRFRLPAPFSRALITCDDPILVPPDASSEMIEDTRLELERAMERARRKAGEYLNHRP